MIIISNEHPHHARTSKKMHPNLIQAHNHHYHQTKTSCRGDLYLKIFKTTKNFFLFWLNKLIILTRNHHFITKKNSVLSKVKLSFIKNQPTIGGGSYKIQKSYLVQLPFLLSYQHIY